MKTTITKAAPTSGFNRQRFNVEVQFESGWRVAYLHAMSAGHAEDQMSFLKKEHPGSIFRVVPVTAFVPHRPNYR